MYVLLIVGDGMADRPLPELNDSTPLEVANPVNMHRLAANGISGLLDPIAPGITPGTEAAHLSILGYDPQVAQSGRGPFEAAGAGIALEAGDLAFRCNFATVDNEFIVVDERAGRIRTEAVELAQVLNTIKLKKHPNVQIDFKQTLGFKGALVLRGKNLSLNVQAPMPKKGDLAGTIKPLDGTNEAAYTADVLNEFTKVSYELLNNHPINMKRRSNGALVANAIIPWSGGKVPFLEPFDRKYGLNAACVAAASVIKGIGKLCGMAVVNVSGATGELDTDTLAKADASLKALESHDFVLLHLEAADEASHDGNTEGKIDFIKKIDAMLGRILDNIDFTDTVIILVSDHVTSTQLRLHTADPVPIVIAGNNIAKDGVDKYNEKSATRGGLGRIQGKDVMPLIMDLFNNP